jgi:cobalamin biosynthesis Mg chelatase CobN
MLERNRPRIYTVRRGCSSLKHNQREELHQVDKTQQEEEDGGRESDGAQFLLEEREGEGEVEQQQQGKYTSVNGRDLELPAATTDAIASGLRQTEQVHAKDREEEDDEDISGAVTGTTVAAIVLLLGIVGIFGAVGFLYREQISDILTQFSDFLKGT